MSDLHETGGKSMMPWGSFFHPRDSKGRESRLLWFVAITWAIMTFRFIAGGIELTFGPIHWVVQPSLVLDYGGAVAAIFSVWVARDWVKDKTIKAVHDPALQEPQSNV